MSADQVQIYTKFFNDMDASGNGELTICELARGLREKCNVQRSEAEIVEMFMGADSDGDKIVTLDEFLNELVYKLPKKEAIQCNLGLWFDQCDKDNDGTLDAEELKKAFKSTGCDATDGEIDDMIAKADVNKDGNICIKEIKRVLAE